MFYSTTNMWQGKLCPALNNHKHLFILFFLTICAFSAGMSKAGPPPQTTSVTIYLEHVVQDDCVVSTENLISGVPGFENSALEAILQPGNAEVQVVLQGSWESLPPDTDVGTVHLDSNGSSQNYIVRTDGGGTVLIVIADF